MTSAIVLPPLTTWAEGHLTAILTATTEANFDAAFDAFVVKEPTHISVNGQQVSREEYKQKTLAESAVGALKRSAQVAFGGAVSVSADKENPANNEAGLVGVFYTSTIFLKLKVGGAHEAIKVNSSINITCVTYPPVVFSAPADTGFVVPHSVIQDKSIREPTGPIRGVDRRRVQTLNQVFTEVPVPIVIQPGGPEIPAAGATVRVQ
ncbi:hypothetical protein FIBSPDRAFT_762579 [Athelia psychrophila]|uniref:Uncharacterized protein n=1 Tax=Athelia psychrophila TaxID=1759441 RepID=A0A165WJG1_9AGAM|nr:hypothetical protein FIBSPDRAFT_762579 [Fibularhizoctonia sp. CBS 109695]